MISAALTSGAAGLAARLAEQARLIAETQARARSAGASRWRRAALLWPLFTKG